MSLNHRQGLTMAQKLNSMRILDQHKVNYTVHEFPNTIHSAVGVADQLGLPHEMVYKTLVVLPNTGKPILAIGS
jgi:Cys-tRNA(Pro)/Cys-tRNA(Cys) deacylase